MLNSKQLRGMIIFPTLHALGLWTEASENLLVMLQAHESDGGEYLAQVDGPALGIYQMEPATHTDIWERFLKPDDSRGRHLIPKILETCNFIRVPDPGEMVGNLYYATIMARIFFLRNREPIPDDLHEMSIYCKKYWNTAKGAATSDSYLGAYFRFEGIKPN